MVGGFEPLVHNLPSFVRHIFPPGEPPTNYQVRDENFGHGAEAQTAFCRLAALKAFQLLSVPQSVAEELGSVPSGESDTSSGCPV